MQVLILKILTYFHWPFESLPFIAIALGAWLTGGLHFDGLMDTADAISAGPEKCLKAMKDSRVGASAILALIINILLQLAALFKLKLLYLYALPIASFWGRYSQIFAIENYNYLHEKGSSKFHKFYWKGQLKESIPSIIVLFFFIVFLSLPQINYQLKVNLILSTILGIFPAIIIPKILANRLKGHSGDSYGASVVLVETFMLIALAIISPSN